MQAEPRCLITTVALKPISKVATSEQRSLAKACRSPESLRTPAADCLQIEPAKQQPAVSSVVSDAKWEAQIAWSSAEASNHEVVTLDRAAGISAVHSDRIAGMFAAYSGHSTFRPPPGLEPLVAWPPFHDHG